MARTKEMETVRTVQPETIVLKAPSSSYFVQQVTTAGQRLPFPLHATLERIIRGMEPRIMMQLSVRVVLRDTTAQLELHHPLSVLLVRSAGQMSLRFQQQNAQLVSTPVVIQLAHLETA